MNKASFSVVALALVAMVSACTPAAPSRDPETVRSETLDRLMTLAKKNKKDEVLMRLIQDEGVSQEARDVALKSLLGNKDSLTKKELVNAKQIRMDQDGNVYLSCSVHVKDNTGIDQNIENPSTSVRLEVGALPVELSSYEDYAVMIERTGLDGVLVSFIKGGKRVLTQHSTIESEAISAKLLLAEKNAQMSLDCVKASEEQMKDEAERVTELKSK